MTSTRNRLYEPREPRLLEPELREGLPEELKRFGPSLAPPSDPDHGRLSRSTLGSGATKITGGSLERHTVRRSFPVLVPPDLLLAPGFGRTEGADSTPSQAPCAYRNRSVFGSLTVLSVSSLEGS